MDEATLAPGLLIAAPHLMDPSFRRAVVLLLENNEEGALGVVVNHESELKLADLCRDQGIPYHGPSQKRVRSGGPVQPDHGLVLFGDETEDEDAQAVMDGLQFSASRDTLRRLCGVQQRHYHCFAGYSGWGAGQLEQEISAGSWVIAPADPRAILDTAPARLWEASFRDLGIDPAAMVPTHGGEA
ncbi:MAG: YqgE/AlgH family protein [Acidobacteriota bacterium]|nr:YqgE/AlgH family protein [Acidobacteriota bacterium]MDH3784493.1 YqgE/AlgH family protein [Acidobacteriota bacterium]